jgi:hypothetical protein
VAMRILELPGQHIQLVFPPDQRCGRERQSDFR